MAEEPEDLLTLLASTPTTSPAATPAAELLFRLGFRPLDGREVGADEAERFLDALGYTPLLGFGVPKPTESVARSESSSEDEVLDLLGFMPPGSTHDDSRHPRRIRSRGERADRRDVYLFESAEGGAVKIGVAGDVGQRLRDCQSGSPVLLTCGGVFHRGGRPLERRLHHWFAEYSLHGEWFRPAPEIVRLFRRRACGNADCGRSAFHGKTVVPAT